MTDYLVAALYKFVRLDDFEALQQPLLQKCKDEDVMGTLLLAREGINGTIAGPEKGIRAVLAYLRAEPRLSALEHKESWASEAPFLRMKVRLKQEIVTMGEPDIDPVNAVGTYVAPEDWNDLISDPDVVVVDTRNDYEVEIGTFKGAINPNTTSFREFPQWVQDSDILKTNKRVAMFCTGGIRCEKSTAYLRAQGVEEVFHLHGGILKYLETVPEQESLWDGECFVFDQRVSVGHALVEGSYDMCHACRHAISDEDKQSPHYVPGVSCPKCHDAHSAKQKKRYADRQKQMDLAKRRNAPHLGSQAAPPPK
ncbi:MAG: rhodanese-related sulfurtransferase [Rhodospirillales bacterium]|jgi:UPF0176 protein|nr:rhodanese-related sulfurtransferase [Rhodospirillales bacterium]MBT4038974.1 rhodanese-related sulfurtransferase [Rhodospirillales bacterium]MBT4626646.1 rhodanese-related sulfurtransferase [Rhodospirillales bacterium]MBT5351882.1 rhodanese-related sulfurtransferase [Rhodospirillales bacterium]MBT5520630.1 rhodanese-related sulfurtransferase [Rhodospirillales bacterium]